MMRDKFPKLSQFLGAYFHQDWYIDDADAKSVIRQYLKGEPNSAVQQAINEIDRLLNLNLDEKQLGDILIYDFCCYYDPSFYNLSYDDWLHWVQTTLKQGIEEIVAVSGARDRL